MNLNPSWKLFWFKWKSKGIVVKELVAFRGKGSLSGPTPSLLIFGHSLLHLMKSHKVPLSDRQRCTRVYCRCNVKLPPSVSERVDKWRVTWVRPWRSPFVSHLKSSITHHFLHLTNGVLSLNQSDVNLVLQDMMWGSYARHPESRFEQIVCCTHNNSDLKSFTEPPSLSHSGIWN